MLYSELQEDPIEPEIELPFIEKPSRATRWKRSVAARLRRKTSRLAMTAHFQKEQDEAIERLKAKQLIEKQKKQKRNKVVDKPLESVYTNNITAL